MNFYFNDIILWMKNGNIKKFHFINDKVNVITGDCETGKSTFLGIIDYCFFATGNEDSGPIRIPQTIINENVSWYGVNFCINENTYTLARKSLKKENIPTNEYYLSTIGEIPDKVYTNMDETKIKELMNIEFTIDDKVVIPYGGNKIKMGSKVSLRYFLLFNSQDDNTITNSDTFFDKQTYLKYQEALSRVFDIAIGISSPEDILIQEKIKETENKLHRYEKKQEVILSNNVLFAEEIDSIIYKSKSLGLIDSNISNEDGLSKLKSLIDIGRIEDSVKNNDLDLLKNKIRKVKMEIREINSFYTEFKTYRNNLANIEDSLKPINLVNDLYGKLGNNEEKSYIDKILDGLELQLTKIKQGISDKVPSDYLIKEKLKELRKQQELLTNEIKTIEESEMTNEKDQYIFMGEVKEKLKYINKPIEKENYSSVISELKNSLESLNKLLIDKQEHKNAILRLFESKISSLLDIVKDSMDTYKGYSPIFNYKLKKTELQKKNSSEIIKVPGSSSNVLFLHLCQILAFHQVVLTENVPYIPSYIFLDQPSRPYYDNKTLKDKARITNVMKLLNDYIDEIKKEYKKHFQVIIVEHIPKEIWKGMENVHLVDEFNENNKLINEEDKL